MEDSREGGRSPYMDYSTSYTPKTFTELSPSMASFTKKYLFSLAPSILFIALSIGMSFLGSGLKLSSPKDLFYLIPLLFDAVKNGAGINTVMIILFAVLLVVAWVLRSPEASASFLLALLLPLPLGVLIKGYQANIQLSPNYLWESYLTGLEPGILLASFLVFIAAELRRRSIKYRITDLGVNFKGGIIRVQEHSIPYQSIGRIVLEQGLLARLLNYGSIILVSPAEWGSEYYTRMVGAETSLGKTSLGVGYARTLKEVSRDPLKCIYGVKNPRRVKEFLEYMVQAPYRAELDQARYLKEIRDEFKGRNKRP